MTFYLDSSVILRVVFGEPSTLVQWKDIDHAVTSALTRVECLRVLDRERIRLRLDNAEVARRADGIHQTLRRIDQIALSEVVLDRASQPFPTTLGTLDAIHLSSALLWRQAERQPLLLCTHDVGLYQAGLSMGLTCLGC